MCDNIPTTTQIVQQYSKNKYFKTACPLNRLYKNISSPKYTNQQKLQLTTAINILCLPEQFTPFPLYPVLQAQVNDPSVLVHVALL